MKNEQGQSTIEFITSFAFGVGVILMIFNSALNHVTGYLAHYATFMASRTYLTSEIFAGGIGNQEPSFAGAPLVARETFNQYNLGIFDVNSDGFQIVPVGGPPDTYLGVGARTSFEKRIDLMGRVTGQTTVNLISESFLGKEPTRAVCATRVCEAMTGGTNCNEETDITLYDNGC